ncbi:Sulfotransferase family protein [Pelagimonas phthalicica]|uniref:Sulfotransferase family protein n=1 Tax=Pelagimonas phthalicica TaxID=1037362 RepID=A0A238JA46_9RHOB|nr:sulfotransferase family 2 domain-containing protein [Pelagimonas phthalicica]TDS93938.1 sulfotransferase family protein [Pelagimonas phthalicica]SMX27538.1 Sulfotransferase family protein [Pelagimonas phthalicica]
MIISPGRNFIFVHIPKTGGTSMALALEARAHRDDILIGDTPKARKRRARAERLQSKGRMWKHSNLADLDGAYSPEQIGEMLCFTLVRNPWDRAVSYYHWLKEQRFDHPAVGLAKQLEFAPFLQHKLTISTMLAWPYGRYMRDVTGQEHGVFLRLEHLEQDMAPLAAHLGFVPELPHENRSDRAEYRSYYDADLRDLLGRLCAEDIARFGYTF